MSRDDQELCPDCNGSGEGQYENTRCRRCHGRGTLQALPDEDDDLDHRFEQDRERRIFEGENE